MIKRNYKPDVVKNNIKYLEQYLKDHQSELSDYEQTSIRQSLHGLKELLPLIKKDYRKAKNIYDYNESLKSRLELIYDNLKVK